MKAQGDSVWEWEGRLWVLGMVLDGVYTLRRRAVEERKDDLNIAILNRCTKG